LEKKRRMEWTKFHRTKFSFFLKGSNEEGGRDRRRSGGKGVRLSRFRSEKKRGKFLVGGRERGASEET